MFFVAVWKVFMPKLGQNLADLITAEAKTKIEETVKHSFQVELETLKASLSKENKLCEIDYSTFHQRRLDVLITLYEERAKMLQSASDCTYLLILGSNEKECLQELTRRWETFVEKARNYDAYRIPNKLLIGEDLFNMLDNEIFKIRQHCVAFKENYRRSLNSILDEEEKNECRDKLPEISNAVLEILGNDEMQACFKELVVPKEYKAPV